MDQNNQEIDYPIVDYYSEICYERCPKRIHKKHRTSTKTVKISPDTTQERSLERNLRNLDLHNQLLSARKYLTALEKYHNIIKEKHMTRPFYIKPSSQGNSPQ